MTLIQKINTTIVNPLIGLMIAIGLVVFLYGVFKFITAAGDETKRKEGKDVIIYGIIGLFIMFGVFGLMNVLASFWR